MRRAVEVFGILGIGAICTGAAMVSVPLGVMVWGLLATALSILWLRKVPRRK